MRGLIIFTTGFVIFLVFILPMILSFAIRYISGGVQPPLKDTKKIYGQYVYSQSFISPEHNLSGIGVSLKNPRLANKNLTFVNLYDDQNKIVRKISLKGENIADGKFVKILFDPIAESSNKKFTWSIYSPDSTKDDALEVFLTDKKPGWSAEFEVNDETTQDSLSYITLHKPKNSIEVLGFVLSEFSSKLTSDFIFFAIYDVLIICLLGYLLFFKSSKSQQRNLKIL